MSTQIIEKEPNEGAALLKFQPHFQLPNVRGRAEQWLVCREVRIEPNCSLTIVNCCYILYRQFFTGNANKWQDPKTNCRYPVLGLEL